MTNNAREQIANAIWEEVDEGTFEYSVNSGKVVDAMAIKVLAALPSILEGMMPDLIWLGGGNRYHTRCGKFAAEFVGNQRRSGWKLLQAGLGSQHMGFFGGNEGLQEAMDEAEKIHIAALLSAIGVET